jgi:pyridoxal biosynthesis lyase PdxS
VIGVTAAILETAKIRIAHQTDITSLRAFDDDNVALVEVLTLMDEFHG